MITGELRSQVDKIWNTFWTGGISNPLTVIEQFKFLLFIRWLDEGEAPQGDTGDCQIDDWKLNKPLYHKLAH
jgi:type I restriction enzyme M protein